MAEKSGIKIAAQNRKAHHDYFVEDRSGTFAIWRPAMSSLRVWWKRCIREA